VPQLSNLDGKEITRKDRIMARHGLQIRETITDQELYARKRKDEEKPKEVPVGQEYVSIPIPTSAFLMSYKIDKRR